MSTLAFSLFGRVQVRTSTSSTPVKIPPSSLLLLAYLLLHPDRCLARDLILGEFWAEQSQEKAKNCLNTALWRLRSALREVKCPARNYLICTSDGDVGFNWASDYWLDVQQFEEQILTALSVDPADLTPDQLESAGNALALYRGDLMEGIYENWALRERERLRLLYIDGLTHLMEHYTSASNYRMAIEQGIRILDLDPLREEIHRQLMRLYVLNGQRVSAVQQFEECRTILARELSIPPMEETQLLCLQIRSQQAPPPGNEITETKQISLQEATAQLRAASQLLADACTQLTSAIDMFDELSK